MEQAPRARARRQDEAGENAARKVEPPHHRVKVVGDPARAKAVDQARAPAGVRAKAEAPDKVAGGSFNILTNQFTPLNFSKKTSEANLTGAIQLINDNCRR